MGDETCANCGRVIGKLETPQVWNESVVCAECRQRLENASDSWDMTITDNAPQLPPKPKTPFFTLGPRVEYIPMIRIKLVLWDSDTKRETVSVEVWPDEVSQHWAELGNWSYKETGKRLRRVEVLARFWGETAKYSAMEKGAIGLGIFSILKGR